MCSNVCNINTCKVQLATSNVRAAFGHALPRTAAPLQLFQSSLSPFAAPMLPLAAFIQPLLPLLPPHAQTVHPFYPHP